MSKKIFLSTLVGFLALSNAALAMDDCSKKTSDSEVFTCAENNRDVAEKN